MEFELDPPRGVGDLRLGMTADEARAVLSNIGDMHSSGGHGGFYTQRPSGLGITVGFGTGSRVNSIELWRPDGGDTVRYQGLDLFGSPAAEVADGLSRLTRVVRDEADNASFIAPDLLLALWRPFAGDDDPEDEQGYYFSSVLVARPGYHDTPVEAAHRLANGGQPGY